MPAPSIPMATGMLPLCFGQATKACGQLLGAGKAYRARLVLGSATDTGDADGQVVGAGAVPEPDRARLLEALASVAGCRDQLPPMYSALKRDGRPLYEFARRGEQVERAPRRITIHRIEALSWAGDAIEFEVECSKGTYVRVLGEEIAAALGTVGHLGALRRLWVEPFTTQSMVRLEDIEAWAMQATDEDRRPPWLLPVDAAFPTLPRLDLDSHDSLHLRQGRTLPLVIPSGAALARVYDPVGRFLGLVEPSPDGGLRVARLFVAGAAGNDADSA
jgi:tRNA pseudouridine55 synthase